MCMPAGEFMTIVNPKGDIHLKWNFASSQTNNG